jgi:hypothetical protein
MVFIHAARLRWEKVADYLCEIVQHILEVDSLYMEYEPVLVWFATICQTIEYPTIPTLPSPCMMWLYRCALKRTQSLSLL